MAFNFLSIGTALGGLTTGYDKAKKAARDEEAAREKLNELKQERESRRRAYRTLQEEGGEGPNQYGDLSGLQSLGGAPAEAGSGRPAAAPTMQRQPAPAMQRRPEPLSAFAPGGYQPEQDPTVANGNAQPAPPAGDASAIPLDDGPAGGQPRPAQRSMRSLQQIEQDESGGRNVPNYKYGPGFTAGGYYQITDTTWKGIAGAAGIDTTQYPNAMSAPREVQQKAAEALYKQEGDRPWKESARGASGNRQIAQAGGGQQAPQAEGLRDLTDQVKAMPAAFLQETQQTAQKVIQDIDPFVRGRMNRNALIQKIDKANPDADPEVKMLTLERINKLLAPEERAWWEGFKQQNADKFRMLLEDRQDIRQDTRLKAAGEQQERSLAAGDARLAAREAAADQRLDKRLNAPKGPAQNIIAFDADGKRTFEGSAIHDPQTKAWTNSANGEAIDAARVETTGKGGATGAGGRGGAQVQRQVIAGREIQSDLEAITQLPITVDRGIFGGRQQGGSLFSALKENLAETLTDEDAQLANSALAGLGRELSVIVSPVYGGKWAAESFSALTLKPGQTLNVKLYNIARMRQVADNALEGVINTDWVGAQQKQFAQKIRDDIDKVVPWTIKDVVGFRSKGQKGESFSDFVSRNQISGAAGRKEPGAADREGTGAGPREGDTATNPATGAKVIYRGGKWAPAGPPA